MPVQLVVQYIPVLIRSQEWQADKNSGLLYGF